MLLIILVALSLTLFGGFLLLTAFETGRGRVGGSVRTRFDKHAARVAFIISHVDWSAFVKHLIRASAERIAHDVAHTSLLVIRFLERMLTRLVRALRERRAGIVVTPVPKKGLNLRETLQKFRKLKKHKIEAKNEG
ncbi:MAG: hypothetical protein KA104_00025 [Candidatus Pacebacteria bacterium]|nr:hypothetical protein [Candidatus Paceibacterota bacterium]